VIDRVSIMNDAEIVDLLKTKFVPVAINVVFHQHQRDAEGDFYRGIATESGQGLYTCQADGKRLGYTNNRVPQRTKDLLARTLADFRPVAAPASKGGQPDAWWVRRPPMGGLIVNVTAKVLGGYEKSEDLWRQAAQASLGRDHLWVRKDEHEALGRGEFPPSLARRIARFHLLDNTRGSASLWEKDEVKKADLALKDGRISGAVHLETASGAVGYKAELRGVVEVREGKVTRLDLVARGGYWGETQYTKGAPKGTYPFAVAFTLSSGQDEADKVPPEANRSDPDEYLR
jgi:hypothetical protein